MREEDSNRMAELFNESIFLIGSTFITLVMMEQLRQISLELIKEIKTN